MRPPACKSIGMFDRPHTEDLPSVQTGTADAPPPKTPARKKHGGGVPGRHVSKDMKGQGLRRYANMRRAQNKHAFPSGVIIDAHFTGDRDQLTNYTWYMADIAGLITWRLVLITGNDKNDRSPLVSTGFIGNGRQSGFDIALEELAKIRPGYGVPAGTTPVIMPRRTQAPTADVDKLILEYKRRLNERDVVEAKLTAAKTAADDLVVEAEKRAAELVAQAKVAAATAKREAQEAFAWNMQKITGLADALAVLGIDVGKLP